MAGPAKKRAQVEKQSGDSSNGSASHSHDLTQRSAPKSIPRLDGNRDPAVRKAVDYTTPNDLKNISEFLGMRGWYAARGVSTTLPNKHNDTGPCLGMYHTSAVQGSIKLPSQTLLP
jgi:hypothetical protein